MKTRSRIALGVLAAVGLSAVAGVGILLAQDKPATAAAAGEQPRQADEAAICEASQALARAFEKGDAKAVAACWTEEGAYVSDDGKRIHRRAALEKAYQEFFAKRAEVKVESKTDKIHFLGTDTAVEEGTFTVKAKDAPPDASRYSALYVRQGGKWQLALLKEWGDESAELPSLDNLAWLIGTWETEGDGPKASTSYEWAENKKFIRCRYTITPKEGAATSGTQVIGIDPATKQIHAWTFDADGGVGEASWAWDGGRWVIESDGTLADGSTTTAVNYLTRSGSDGFTWRSVKRALDGESLPDVGPVKVKRVAGGK